jgi:hypothetical protein
MAVALMAGAVPVTGWAIRGGCDAVLVPCAKAASLGARRAAKAVAIALSAGWADSVDRLAALIVGAAILLRDAKTGASPGSIGSGTAAG